MEENAERTNVLWFNDTGGEKIFDGDVLRFVIIKLGENHGEN